MSLVRLPELQIMLGGVGKTTLHRWEANDKFPKRIRIGDRAVAWDRAAVNAWLASRQTVNVNCKDARRTPTVQP